MCRSAGCVLWAVIAVGCAGSRPRPTVVAELDGQPPADCKSLGEVNGRWSSEPVVAEPAHEEALRKAEALGATHVKVVLAKTGRVGSNTEVWTGLAYRCLAAK